MSITFKKWIQSVALIIGSTSVCVADTDAVISAADLQSDFQYLQKTLLATHPDVYASADQKSLADAFATITSQLNKPMTRDEAWRVLAALNPVFADTHVTVVSPDSIGQTTQLLKSGGGLFPFEVTVTPSGEVYVVSALGGGKSPWHRAQILSVNGQPISSIVAALLARTNGDSLAFRAGNLSRRWWWFYWKTMGLPAQFEMHLKLNDKVSAITLPTSQQTPEWLLDDGGEVVERAFQFELHADGVGVLTVNTFYWPDKAAFLAFTQQAFAKLKANGAKTLIIDIRKNGGGDDDMWKDGIMPYLADKPYRHGSSYQLKIIEGRQREGQKVGDVVSGGIETWNQPANDQVRFNGEVYVLIGRSTYSSAVLFANTMQDFGFAKLVGTGGFARTRQTGGIQKFTLPNSKLNIIVPRFVLDRPSGKREPIWLTPDIEMTDDLFEPQQLIAQLKQRLLTPAVALEKAN